MTDNMGNETMSTIYINCGDYDSCIQKHYCRQRHLRGMSLVEILIALTIAALLLTATAAAFDAAFDDYKTNDDMNYASMSARNVLFQMCSELRSAWNDPQKNTIDINSTGNRCAFVDSLGRNVIYYYSHYTKRLWIKMSPDDHWHVMMDNVYPVNQDGSIFSDVAPDDASFPDGTVGRIDILFKVKAGKVSRVFSSSVVPRNIVYAK